jgi:stearoyl-CoA desaturase (delta-9 desaturase)
MHVLAIFSLWWLLDYWLVLLSFWFVFGVIGNGVAAHRYFAHGQFSVAQPVRWMLGFLASLGGIGPANYWAIQHKVHHMHADTAYDPHTPVNGFWHTMYAWTFPQGKNADFYLQHRFAKRLAIKHAKDPFYKFFNQHHYTIIYIFCAVLFVIDPVLVLVYAAAYALDFIRLGLVNWFCHRGGYRNHATQDCSTNNVWLGWLGMGFGWHNNHHAHPGKLILTERWWEIDVEGYIGWLLSKTTKNKRHELDIESETAVKDTS